MATTTPPPPPTRKQKGVMLLEALIAVVIFSIGVLALIGMQANGIKQVADAKLRVDAGYLASQIISQMWIDRSNLAQYAHYPSGSNCTFSGSASSYGNVTNWIGETTKAGTVAGTLPNASAQIIVEASTNLVTVTICWRAPQETQAHNFMSTALISG